MPFEVTEDIGSWNFFLQEAGECLSDWRVSWISPEQAKSLLDLLEKPMLQSTGSTEGWDLLRELRTRAGEGS